MSQFGPAVIRQAGKQKGFGSISRLPLSFSLQKGCSLKTLSRDFVPRRYGNIKTFSLAVTEILRLSLAVTETLRLSLVVTETLRLSLAVTRATIIMGHTTSSFLLRVAGSGPLC